MRWKHALAIAVGLAFSSPALWLPNLWASFVFPGIAFCVLQFVALGDWSKREVFFKLTDYVYYLLLGAVVAIASTVLLRLDEARLVDAQVEMRSLESALVSADRDIPRFKSEQSDIDKLLDATDKEFVAECRAQQVRLRLKPDQKRGIEIARFEPCLGYLGLEGRAVQLRSAVARLENSRVQARARLDELRRMHPEGAAVAPVSLEAQYVRGEMEVRWLTLFALVGAALKLGKTTSSLRPLPK